MDERMTTVINWELEKAEFQEQINELIQTSSRLSKVIPLPMVIKPGQTFIDLVTMLLAQVQCGNCDARCCQRNPDGSLIVAILPPEYDRLSKKYGEGNFTQGKNGKGLTMPCAFLKGPISAKNGCACSVYDDRPLVCVIYPFQPGAHDGSEEALMAVASDCPEGRRIANAIYNVQWRIRKQFHALGEEDFIRGLLGQDEDADAKPA